MAHGAAGLFKPMFAMGATITIRRRLVPGEVLNDIAVLRITHMMLPPTSLYAFLSHSELSLYDYSSLRMLLLFGSATRPDALKKAIHAFGPCVCQFYAQAETGYLTWLDAETLAAAANVVHPQRLSSCGRACWKAQLAVMNDCGELLPPGRAGEIVAQGDSLRSYYRDPERTEKARVRGWHRTGDVGYMDGDGYYYLLGRSPDRIKTSGLGVFAREIETTIGELSGVQECAVVGLPDQVVGELVVAVVVAAPNSVLTEESVIAHCRGNLGRVRAPRAVESWSKLPKTSVGKVDTKQVRQILLTTRAIS